MDFAPSPRAQELAGALTRFMDEFVYPAEAVYADQMRQVDDPHHHPEILEHLKHEAHQQGLWNLFHPDPAFGAGLTNLEYAPLAEIMGHSINLAPEATNCNAPDTGNMEILSQFGTPDQKRRWLEPLLAGEIRSAFAMTEPAVASSDATNIETSIVRYGDGYVINGRKWWITNALSPRCRVLIVMGKTDPEGPRHRQQSMLVVPIDTAGITVERSLPVFGYLDREGHGQILFENVRVPATALLAGEGEGFRIAQARLGPGRVHHCMRSIGLAERALQLLCERADSRVTFGRPVSANANIQDWIAEARIDLEMIRLLVLKTAWLMDTVGNQAALSEIAAIKVAAPAISLRILDRAIQVHGGAGVSDDFPLARMYAHERTMRLADGPDEVHKRTIARHELRRQQQDRDARRSAELAGVRT